MKKILLIFAISLSIIFSNISYCGAVELAFLGKKMPRNNHQLNKLRSKKPLNRAERHITRNGKLKEINGKKVICNDKSFDKKTKDAYGRRNCERMSQGLAPIGKDNIEINLHHLQQENDGVIVEVLATEHQKYSEEILTLAGAATDDDVDVTVDDVESSPDVTTTLAQTLVVNSGTRQGNGTAKSYTKRSFLKKYEEEVLGALTQYGRMKTYDDYGGMFGITGRQFKSVRLALMNSRKEYLPEPRESNGISDGRHYVRVSPRQCFTLSKGVFNALKITLPDYARLEIEWLPQNDSAFGVEKFKGSKIVLTYNGEIRPPQLKKLKGDGTDADGEAGA